MPDLDLQPESPPTSQLDSSNETKDDDISPSEKKKRNKEVGTFFGYYWCARTNETLMISALVFIIANDFIYEEYFVS